MTRPGADPDASADGLVWLPAPAKLNLFLHVIGRRADGYHLLQTVFQLLDWGDRIGLAVTDDGAIQRSGGCPDLPAGQDLAVRAALALQRESGVRSGARIHIDKHIPVGAGLGGGSSDAATVLVGLDHLWRTGLAVERLAQIGARLGADVPVFVHGHSAFAEGVGEKLTPVSLPGADFVVVWPGLPVATADIFQAPELTRNTPASTISALLQTAAGNDLQPVAVRRHPEIGQALAFLCQHGPARMSGSGSAVFVPVADAATAQAIVADSPWPAWAVRGVNRSPLQQLLAGDGR
ncbi:MAG: 4-(cytidine 5'-diphospho)-2-C-methyl-D-erythritol kinase [Xanthomonadales bacterium]|nr:4-(cytidine 5'-diphospho)-2-C-methyl-D-erythritol kinase [Xanthomonadales bacterium]